MRLTLFGILSGVFVTACIDLESGNPFSAIESRSTTSLWIEQNSTRSPIQLALIEAELGVRGETVFLSYYLGKRTRSTVGRTVYARETRAEIFEDLVNCSDFLSSAAAQKYFLSFGGPLLDPNGLDRDGDGLACEWGTNIEKIAANYAVSTQRRVSANRCYVGPRGGTYTLTASGNRNYSGC